MTEMINETVDENVLDKYDRFIRKICMQWIISFKHDRSIDVDDLMQEAKIRILTNFDKMYNPDRGSKMTYISSIVRNFFISKYKMMKLRNCFISECDLYRNNSDDGELTVLDKIADPNLLPDQHIEAEELFKLVKKRLREVQYTPKPFTRRIRSFTEIVFDHLVEPDYEMQRELLFDLRCKQRLARKLGKKIPNKANITAAFLAKKINVDIRSVNKAMILIKQIVNECSLNLKKGGQK